MYNRQFEGSNKLELERQPFEDTFGNALEIMVVGKQENKAFNLLPVLFSPFESTMFAASYSCLIKVECSVSFEATAIEHKVALVTILMIHDIFYQAFVFNKFHASMFDSYSSSNSH